MSFLGRLFGRSSGRGDSPSGDEHALYYYLRCNKCGEVIRVRIDRRWDLEQEFDEGGGDAATGYVARKEVMGTKCFQMLRLTIAFNRGYHETDRQLSGGTFIEREEYEAAQAAKSAEAADESAR